MDRKTMSVWLCLAISLSGCQFANKSTAKNTPPKSDNFEVSSSVVGSEFTSSNKLKDPIKIHLAYAAWHEQAGELAEAREAYLKVLQKSSRDVDAQLGLVRIDRAYGRHDEADKQLKETLKQHPKDPKVYVAVGQTHAARHEWDEALESMRTAHRLSPYDTIYEYHLAVVETQAGDIQQAMEHFTRSIGEAEAHFNIGYILNQQGRTTEAETHVIKALKMKPELKQAQSLLASIRTGGADDEIQPASFKRSRP